MMRALMEIISRLGSRHGTLNTMGAIAMTGLLAGCVNTEQTLVKGDNIVNCNAVGWGLVGAPLSYASYRHCVDFYTAQGYLAPH